MMIEDGKFYKTRDGRKVGPMTRSGTGWADAKTWQFDNGGNRWDGCPQLWNGDGEVLMRDEPWDSVDDIVAIWQDGPVVTETVTKTRIVPGVYDGVEVYEDTSEGGWVVEIEPIRVDGDTADRLAAVLSALAKGLRDVG